MSGGMPASAGRVAASTGVVDVVGALARRGPEPPHALSAAENITESASAPIGVVPSRTGAAAEAAA